jgi:phage terminase large subunit-like protein
VQDLTGYGIEMHSLAQTMRFLSYPTMKLEEMASKSMFEHFENPVLSWMVSQSEIIKDSKGNIMLTKKNQNKKVDGVSALINAIAEWETYRNQDDGEGFFMVKLNSVK